MASARSGFDLFRQGLFRQVATTCAASLREPTPLCQNRPDRLASALLPSATTLGACFGSRESRAAMNAGGQAEQTKRCRLTPIGTRSQGESGVSQSARRRSFGNQVRCPCGYRGRAVCRRARTDGYRDNAHDLDASPCPGPACGRRCQQHELRRRLHDLQLRDALGTGRRPLCQGGPKACRRGGKGAPCGARPQVARALQPDRRTRPLRRRTPSLRRARL